jgi:hypothetical protein
MATLRKLRRCILTDSSILEFVSRECKTDEHTKCDGRWSGLGFEIVCTCKCGHLKEGPTLERLGGLHSNESQPASLCKLTGVEPRV